ncbi:hypothetical protein D3C78_1953470 [compost metagenome]
MMPSMMAGAPNMSTTEPMMEMPHFQAMWPLRHAIPTAMQPMTPRVRIKPFCNAVRSQFAP